MPRDRERLIVRCSLRQFFKHLNATQTNMATSMSTMVHQTARMVLKSSVGLCLWQRTGLFAPRRCCHGARSSLYEHVREGYSDKPELDMRAVCEETHKVISNVESRKGDLRGDDVRKMVRVVWGFNQ